MNDDTIIRSVNDGHVLLPHYWFGETVDLSIRTDDLLIGDIEESSSKTNTPIGYDNTSEISKSETTGREIELAFLSRREDKEGQN